VQVPQLRVLQVQAQVPQLRVLQLQAQVHDHHVQALQQLVMMQVHQPILVSHRDTPYVVSIVC
jgi:hypothetical protein